MLKQVQRTSARAQADAAIARQQVALAETRLEELYASTSWRITAPLRWLSQAARFGGPLRPPKRTAKGILRRIAHIVLPTVRRQPSAQRLAKFLRTSHPGVCRQLKRMASSIGSSSTPLAPATTRLWRGRNAYAPQIAPATMPSADFISPKTRGIYRMQVDTYVRTQLNAMASVPHNNVVEASPKHSARQSQSGD